MGDGFTHARRDRKRLLALSAYLETLLDWIRGPDDSGREKVIAAANLADSIGNGYFTGPTAVAQGLESRLQRLGAGDAKEWHDLMNAVQEDFPELYRSFYDLSPFGGKKS